MIHDVQIGDYWTYGILAVEGVRILRWLPDVSTDGRQVEALVERMNLEQVDLCHMEDVVLDWLER